jgi:arabinogalactan oligomer/maltooligosaccharide transport system substrate-binding protein
LEEENTEPMKKSQRLFGLLAGLTLVVSACGPSASPSPSTSASTPASIAPSGSAPATSDAPSTAPLSGELDIWHTYASGAGTESATYDAIIADIESNNPDLAITTTVQNFFGAGNIFEVYALEAQTGGGPDMFIVPNDSLGAQVRQDLLQPLDDLAGDLSVFSDLAVTGCTVDDVLYCIPESLKAVGMYYNASQVADPPTTTDELLAAIEAGDVKAGFDQGAYHNFGWWAAFGGELMDDSGKCIADTTGVADAHAYLAELKAAGATFYPDYADLAADFNEGVVNLIIDGPWASGGYAEALGDDLGVAALPEGPDGPGQPMTGTDGWFINPNSDNQELAAQVAYLISTEYEQQFVDDAGHVPAVTTATVSDPITEGFAEAVANGFPRPQAQQLDNFWGNFETALDSVIDTGADPQEAVATACAAMNEANNIQ